jgi:hypothetical protein
VLARTVKLEDLQVVEPEVVQVTNSLGLAMVAAARMGKVLVLVAMVPLDTTQPPVLAALRATTSITSTGAWGRMESLTEALPAQMAGSSAKVHQVLTAIRWIRIAWRAKVPRGEVETAPAWELMVTKQVESMEMAALILLAQKRLVPKVQQEGSPADLAQKPMRKQRLVQRGRGLTVPQTA